MFPYDSVISAAVQTEPTTIPAVLGVMEKIDATCDDVDGLKWFNSLYLAVTQAVETRVNAGGFADPDWLAQLDVQFASLYFDSITASLAGIACPGCWDALFSVRNNTRLGRIQFALAGINAHINHDLSEAIVATCKATNTVPRHCSPHYSDYKSLNATLDGLIQQARTNLNVRLLGDPLPAASTLENTIAAWDIAAARENAWNNAQQLWYLPAPLANGLLDSVDGLTTVIGKALLAPIP